VSGLDAFAAVQAAVRPPRAAKPVRIDPERAAAGRPSRPVRVPSRPVPDNSRVGIMEIDASGAIVLHAPARAMRDGTAAATLKIAQAAAPGAAIKVVRGRHVLASVAASPAPAPVAPPVVVPAPGASSAPPVSTPADPGPPVGKGKPQPG
jgi:hypothetical protein